MLLRRKKEYERSNGAEAFFMVTAAQTGETIPEGRARTAESLRKVKARLGDVADETLKRARAVAGEAEDVSGTVLGRRQAELAAQSRPVSAGSPGDKGG